MISSSFIRVFTWSIMACTSMSSMYLSKSRFCANSRSSAVSSSSCFSAASFALSSVSAHAGRFARPCFSRSFSAAASSTATAISSSSSSGTSSFASLRSALFSAGTAMLADMVAESTVESPSLDARITARIFDSRSMNRFFASSLRLISSRYDCSSWFLVDCRSCSHFLWRDNAVSFFVRFTVTARSRGGAFAPMCPGTVPHTNAALAGPPAFCAAAATPANGRLHSMTPL
mmetsp:Transcript_21568/g.45014  ORF Transcript_21568/g.45014 Transcript_21568/m.45014 type:complete len:231 (-) Transcript_21568:221-913(-)